MTRFAILGVVLVSALLWVAPAGAAQGEGRRLVINPQVGANATRYSTDPSYADTEARIGWQAGLFLRYGKRTYFQPGAFYQRTSVNITPAEDTDLDDLKFTNDVTSLWVPVLIGVDVVSSDLITLRLNGGVAGTFVTKVEENDLGLTKDDFKSFRSSGVVGTGVDITVVSVDLSYEFGLGAVFEEGDAKAHTGRLTVGMTF